MAVWLIGHGGWDVTADPAYASVPKGTTITYFTENLKLLYAGNAAQITSMSQMFSDAEPNQTVEEYKSTPNYTLYALEPDLRAFFDQYNSDLGQAIYVGDGVPNGIQLCTDAAGDVCEGGVHRCSGLFALDEVQGQEIYWIACRHVDLKEVGGAALGVNVGQDTLGYLPEGWEDWIRGFLTLGDADRLTHWQALDQSQQQTILQSMDVRTWAEGQGLA